MLRPTLKEILSGFQRTVVETLLPELTSPELAFVRRIRWSVQLNGTNACERGE